MHERPKISQLLMRKFENLVKNNNNYRHRQNKPKKEGDQENKGARSVNRQGCWTDKPEGLFGNYDIHLQKNHNATPEFT